MKNAQYLLAAFGLVSAASSAYVSGYSNETTVWTTVTTDVYTTYCPESTTFTQGTKTYTATASETLTITDCPCTIVKPTTYPIKPTTSAAAPPPPHYNGTWVPPVWITTTETVSSYTTYCPAPTTVVQNNVTYTVSSATTLTITACPCTQTKTCPATVSTTVVSYLTTYCPQPTTITYSASTYPVTSPGTVTIPIAPYTTVTTLPITTGTVVPPPISASSPVGTGSLIITSATNTPKAPSATPSGPAQVSANAGMKVDAGFGAFAAAGLAALLL
ncbi:hypothetical protein NA56DRAFT_703169 [Hyaloscypha hepaticicola]|uniref:Cell wall protein SED1 n=1 Tax=Hyaloscypha hepaticicola TaxID=2082293 RepID=A0A2J6Q5G2_9HELO|nr:hypothetical protein NA56DRAFT_703169 [Hyaloscypha hepaticicola]